METKSKNCEQHKHVSLEAIDENHRVTFLLACSGTTTDKTIVERLAER